MSLTYQWQAGSPNFNLGSVTFSDPALNNGSLSASEQCFEGGCITHGSISDATFVVPTYFGTMETPSPLGSFTESVAVIFNADQTLTGAISYTESSADSFYYSVSGNHTSWSGRMFAVWQAQCFGCVKPISGYWLDAPGSVDIPEPSSFLLFATLALALLIKQKFARS